MMYVRKSMGSYVIAPLSLVLLLCGVFGIVWLRSNLISMEYGISELEKARLDRLRETKMLMAEKSSLLSTQKLEKTAAGNMGLVLPDRRKVVFVKRKDVGSYKASFEAGLQGSPDRKVQTGSEVAGRGTL
jgi:hypothetical protein